MRYEQIVLEFSNYIWFLQTHSEYIEPSKELYNYLTNRIAHPRCNADKFYSYQNMRNTLINIEDSVNICRNTCLQIKSGYDKYNNEFYSITMRINELMNTFNSDNISKIIFMNEMNKAVQRLNNLLINSYVE